MSDAEGSPFHAYNFRVVFAPSPLGEASEEDQVNLAHGAFSEITGLEATVEPFAINEGGLNYGQHQRVGRTTFSTVILKRGMTASADLYQFFREIHGGHAYRRRMSVTIELLDGEGATVTSWTLDKAMPVKLKLTDLNATGQEVGVEELHLVHEGITEGQRRKRPVRDDGVIPAGSPDRAVG